jgi:glucose-1-phosphatase
MMPQEKTIPQAVIFDLGKVLLNFDYGIVIERLHGRSKMSKQELHRLIDQSPLLYRYETNLLSTEQFFGEIRNATQFAGDLAEFAAMFGDIFTPIQPMIELHAALRRHRIPLFIFSNTNYMAVDHIRRSYPFFGEFDGYILSCEHCAMKPDAKLYEVVEKLSRKRGAELLYIDDRQENITAGLARGWQSILHETPEKTWQAVERTGLLSGNSSPFHRSSI